MKKQIKIFWVLIFILEIAKASATVKLPAIFYSNMVLQQQSQVPFRGEAAPNKTVKITTSWNNKIIETNTNTTGKWKTLISTPVFGGPYNIEITDGKKLKLELLMGKNRLLNYWKSFSLSCIFSI